MDQPEENDHFNNPDLSSEHGEIGGFSKQSPIKSTGSKMLYQRNLPFIWLGCFITGMGMSVIMPFMPLFIDTLGTFTTAELNFWSGLIPASSFFVTAIISPAWGKLADRYGRRPMLIRSSCGMAVGTVLMAFSHTVWQLLACRLLFGLFSGYIANAIALIATEVPKEESGKILGTLQTAGVTGILLGPIAGGALASFLDYPTVYMVTGISLVAVVFISLFLIKEDFVPPEKGKTASVAKVFAGLDTKRLIIGMFITTLLIQLTNMSINPVISLYVREILGGTGSVEMMSGLAASAPGLATLIAARGLGALGDRIGTQKVLLSGLAVTAVVFIPMAMVTEVWQLIVLRFILGIGNAALLPAVQTLITRNTPHEAISRIFSFNQSFQAVGSMLGPMVGSTIASMFDYTHIFYAMFFFALANIANVFFATRKAAAKKEVAH